MCLNVYDREYRFDMCLKVYDREYRFDTDLDFAIAALIYAKTDSRTEFLAQLNLHNVVFE